MGNGSSSLGLRPRDDLDPLAIPPRDAISLHPSGSCSKNILLTIFRQFDEIFYYDQRTRFFADFLFQMILQNFFLFSKLNNENLCLQSKSLYFLLALLIHGKNMQIRVSSIAAKSSIWFFRVACVS